MMKKRTKADLIKQVKNLKARYRKAMMSNDEHTTALQLVQIIVDLVGAEFCDLDQAGMVLNNMLIEGEIGFSMDFGMRFKKGSDAVAVILEYAKLTLFSDDEVCDGCAQREAEEDPQ